LFLRRSVGYYSLLVHREPSTVAVPINERHGVFNKDEEYLTVR